MARSNIDNEDENEDVKPKGSSTKMLIIILAVLLLVLIAGGVTTYFLLSGDKSEKPAEQADVEAAPVEEVVRTPIYVPLNPAFLANFEDQSTASYLQVDVQVMTYSKDVEEAIKVHMPRIRNDLLLLFSSQKFDEINTVKGKRKLSTDALKVVRDVLESARAPSEVEAVLFTSFVMQ